MYNLNGENMKVLIGTKNKSKIEGAKKAFDMYFDNVEIEGINVESNVSKQPVNNEIFKGAVNRVNNLYNYVKENDIQFDYLISVESGIINLYGNYFIMSVSYIKDKNNYESFGISSSYPVPNKYVDDIIKNDLSSVMDKIFKGHDLNKGSIDVLTHNKINRIDLTYESFVMALTKYINKDLWKD